jgi:hypothetical protein
MNRRFLRIEHILYAAALIFALAIRLAKLGSLPLNNDEAALALQAWEVARGGSPLIDPHPAYLALTSALMFLFSASAWVARFWPALAGSLLVLLPALFRQRLGSLPALLLAFFLALDPALLSISRQAGSLPLALLFTLLTLALWWKGYRLMAGIAAGLALLSGPAVWPGVFALAAAWLIAIPRRPVKSMGDASGTSMTENPEKTPVVEPDGQPINGDSVNWARVIAAALVTAFLVGTLFLRIPNGLGAAAGSLAAYLRGWVMPSGTSLVLLLIALLTHAFLPLFLGLWGALRGLLRSDPVDRFLFVWWGAALVLALAYPGRAVADLLWSVLPLWALAARQVARLLNIPSFDRMPVIGQALLSGIIFVFISLTAVSLANVPNLPQQQVTLRLAGAAVMLVASTALMAWGWSKSVAVRGLVTGLSLILLAYTISVGWDAAGFTGQKARDLFTGSSPLQSADLLDKTIDQLNQWAPSQPGGLELVAVDIPSDALRWQLRNIQRVRFVELLPRETSPDLILSPNLPDLELAATYRGQSFVLSEETTWEGFSAADWFRWLVFRQVPAGLAAQQQIILWARIDLFPGGLEEAGGDLSLLSEFER